MTKILRRDEPLRIVVERAGHFESVHFVDVLAVDAGGNALFRSGNPELRFFPRSAVKIMQALPLVESGAADAFGLADRHLALACASHNGEERHVSAAREMLASANLDATCLECGVQTPMHAPAAAHLYRSGETPSALTNNCSGKHAGFLAYAHHMGIKHTGYIKPDHPVQREIAAIFESMTDVSHNAENRAIDGCSIPTWQISLSSLALAFARIAAGEAMPPIRKDALKRLMSACFQHPEMVAGEDRCCTKVMQILRHRAFVKVGAEGVYTASLPELGIGIALKARCGTTRAAEVALVHTLESLLELDERAVNALKKLSNPILKNWNGYDVATLRAVM